MKEELISLLKSATISCGIHDTSIKIDYPENPDHGDFSTNVAMINAKKLGTSPKDLADKIIGEFNNHLPDFVQSVDVAGPGFINFFVKDAEFAREILKINSSMKDPSFSYGRLNASVGEKIMVEYTDPNTFKVFHIGHLMSNAIGESIVRLAEYSGAKMIRLCYSSDIGLHIAKAVWALQKHFDEMPSDSASIQSKTEFLGKMYVEGVKKYDEDEDTKMEIDILNKVIYERSDPTVIGLYEKGRRWSLEHFEMLYKTLGTSFDDMIFESDMAPIGLEIVREYMKKGVFEESQNAVVFSGEKFGLHTRVFVNSRGIPTYEAKDIGLNVTKFKKYPDASQSVIITANEQDDYFKVLIKVLSLIDEKNGSKTRHIGHGMMRFIDGKMSSRTGNVITAESLFSDIKEIVSEKIADRKFTKEEADEISDIIVVGAIKYTILRQSIGSDVAFDSATSVSFEGDSGPYLQYSAVRARSIIEKAREEGMIGAQKSDTEFLGAKNFREGDILSIKIAEKVGMLEKLIVRFPHVVERSRVEYAPQNVANYLTSLAGAFNNFYATQTIVDRRDELSPYYLALVRTFLETMTNGLWLLGIKVPDKM